MRRHYLDNLRWVTVCLVLVYHVCYLFNGVGIPGAVPGAANLPLGDWFAAAVYPWFMVLLFLVAGMSSRYALEKRSGKEFLKERAVKLLVPSTLGLFVLHWVTGYLNIKLGGGLAYIPGFLVYPISAVSGTGPLWFAQMLFLFSLVLVLLKKLDKEDRVRRRCGDCPLWLSLPAGFLLLWGGAQVGNLPVLTMYRFGIYFVAFALGYLLFSHEHVMAAVGRGAWVSLMGAAAAGTGYLLCFGGKDFTAAPCLQSFVTNAYAWLAALALLGVFYRRFDRTNRVCAAMTGANFGLYVLHYPAFLWSAHLVTAYASLPAAANYLIVLVCGTGTTVLAYEVIRRVPVLRFFVLGERKRPGKKLPEG